MTDECAMCAKPALDVAALRRVAEAALPRLYLDCDGVLADFDAAFIEKFGHAPHAYEERHGSKTFWRDIRHEAPTFYRDLPLMPGARKLVEAIRFLRPIILTGCPMGGWAEAQKIEWAAEHFPGVPVVTCMSRNKASFCQPGDILVDDRPKYAHHWRKAGGVFILHDGADDSIQTVYAALSVSPALALLDELERARAGGWRPISEHAPPDDGTQYLALLAAKHLGSRIHTANTKRAQSSAVTIVAGSFAFDLPPITHWMPLPKESRHDD